MKDSTIRLKQLAEAATPGPYKACFHLESKENDESCPCGYRGGVWSTKADAIICEMGGSKNEMGDLVDPQGDREQIRKDGQYLAAANPQAVLGLIARIEELEKHLALALSFAPKGPVPKGLAPMFYHTLD